MLSYLVRDNAPLVFYLTGGKDRKREPGELRSSKESNRSAPIWGRSLEAVTLAMQRQDCYNVAIRRPNRRLTGRQLDPAVIFDSSGLESSGVP